MENNAKDLNLEAETLEMTDPELDDVSGGLKKAYTVSQKSLENENKLGNFEIQGLMSTFNQPESLKGQGLKKKDGTTTGVNG